MSDSDTSSDESTIDYEENLMSILNIPQLTQEKPGDNFLLNISIVYTKYKMCFLNIPPLCAVGQWHHWYTAAPRKNTSFNNVLSRLNNLIDFEYFFKSEKQDVIHKHLDNVAGNIYIQMDSIWTRTPMQNFYYQSKDLYKVEYVCINTCVPVMFIDFCCDIDCPKFLHTAQQLQQLRVNYANRIPYSILIRLPYKHKQKYIDFILENMDDDFYLKKMTGVHESSIGVSNVISMTKLCGFDCSKFLKFVLKILEKNMTTTTSSLLILSRNVIEKCIFKNMLETSGNGYDFFTKNTCCATLEQLKSNIRAIEIQTSKGQRTILVTSNSVFGLEDIAAKMNFPESCTNINCVFRHLKTTHEWTCLINQHFVTHCSNLKLPGPMRRYLTQNSNIINSFYKTILKNRNHETSETGVDSGEIPRRDRTEYTRETTNDILLFLGAPKNSVKTECCLNHDVKSD